MAFVISVMQASILLSATTGKGSSVLLRCNQKRDKKILHHFNLPKEGFDSFVLIDNGRAYKKSTAGLKVYNKLPWYWKWTQLGWIAPRFVRDAVYDFIARNRYKWFGKKEECSLPTPDVRSRFLHES